MTGLPLLLAAPLLGQDCFIVDSPRIEATTLVSRIPAFAQLPRGTSLGFAPAPGLTRWLRGSALQRFGAHMGIDTGPVADLCVQRSTRVYTQREVESAIRSVLPEAAKLEVVDYCRLALPSGQLSFRLSSLSRPSMASRLNQTVWRGEVIYDERRSAPIWASVRITIPRMGLVAARDIPQGHILTSGDFCEHTWQGSFQDSAPLSNPSEAEGKEARRRIRAGLPLTAQLLVEPPEVTRGDRIKVRVESGVAVVGLEAVAGTNGRRGESVVVENAATGKRFKAEVAGKGRVVVRVEDQDENKKPSGSRRNSIAGGSASSVVRRREQVKETGDQLTGSIYTRN